MNIKTALISTIMVILLSLVIIPDQIESQESEDPSKWTFLVYLDSDNNLESEGIADMNEMEAVGSTEDVNIVVQMDRWDTDDEGDDESNGDWTDTRRFLMEKDSDRNEISTEEVEILGETNMGDPETLIDFVKWGIDNYPAENYAIVLWDHGGAFWGVCWDEGLPEGGEHDHINMTELKYAMEEIYLHRGSERIELLGFDACLMAQMGVLYQVKDFASVVCASGFSEPGGGWPYTEILDPLTRNPTINEQELSQIIVDEYVESYPEPMDQMITGISMAAFDMTQVNDVVITMDRFSEELARGTLDVGLDYLLQIYRARNRAQSYDMVNLYQYDITGYPMYDVVDFTEELEAAILKVDRNAAILSLCRELRSVIEDRFIIKSKVDDLHAGSTGLTMYFPNKDQNLLEANQIPTEYDERYEELDFPREHLWDDFLHAYYELTPIKDAQPVVTIDNPGYNATFLKSDERIIITGTAYDKESIESVEIRIDGGEWIQLPSQGGQGRITWKHTLNLKDLSYGKHLIEARASDSLHTTEPVSTVISVRELPDQGGVAFSIPGVMVEIVAGLAIATLFVFGLFLYKGKRGD